MFDLIGDVLEKSVKVVTQPVRDVADVFQGLTEGELRTKAIARLGADAVGAMALSEVIEHLGEDL